MSEQTRQPSEAPKKTREQIEHEIVQSRAALSEDLAALGEKLSPEHLKEGAREVIREVKHAASDSIREAKEAAVGSLMEAKHAAVGSLREAKDHAFESVTERVHELGEGARRVGYATSGFVSTHALPLGLLGLGVGWLALSMSHQRRQQSGYYAGRYDTQRDDNDWGSSGNHALRSRARLRPLTQGPRERAAELASGVGSRAAELTDGVRHRAAELTDGVRHRAAELTDGARHRAAELTEGAAHGLSELREHATDLGHDAYAQVRRAGARSQDFATENPLAVGAIAVAAGIGVGLLLPTTSRENEWLGETRDKIWDDARQAASRVGEKFERAAGDLKEALVEPSAR